jgi:putative ABC transport system permease protein
VFVGRGWSDPLAVGRRLLFVLGGLLVLVATLTATGLAVIGGSGAVLGLLVGFARWIAIAYPLTVQGWSTVPGQVVIDIPWLLLAGVAVLVPLLAVVVTGLAVRSRLPMSRRRW